MRINFYPVRQFQDGAGLAALGAVGPAGLVVAGAQTAVGIAQAAIQGARAKRLMKRRRAYQTPEEIFQIQQALTNRASGGYDPGTLSYLTGESDRAFSSSLSAATRLGADPNQLSELLDRRIQSTFRIGAENQLQNMKNFQGYIDALGLVAENKAAEQKSQQDLIKDELQAASAGQQAGFQNILGGVQTGLNTLAAAKTASLYQMQQQPVNVTAGNQMFSPAERSVAPPAGVNQIQIGGVAPQPRYTMDEIMALLTQGKLIGQ